MKVFVGWDSREDIAYQVCRHSIVSRQSSADVVPLKQKDLRSKEIYWRPIDPLASTEFTFTRFLVPHLMNYKGWAVFCDCDIIFVEDIKELFDQADDQYAVMVVKHDYKPKSTVKMDGKEQFQYPRKNWSSVILWNCAHPQNKELTPKLVNEKSGQYLHRFEWLKDNQIGELKCEWNWLVGWHKEPEDGKPKAIHYTEGGPWFPNYVKCEYGANWILEKLNYEDSKLPEAPTDPFVNIPQEIKNLFNNVLKYRVDPAGEWFNVKEDDVVKELKMLNNNAVYAVDGGRDPEDNKGHPYDPFMVSFITGSGGQITNYDKVEQSMTPVVFRGITKSKHMRKCEEIGRNYYYIDTGYFGNGRKKLYHRITKNAMQACGPIIERPLDRLAATGYQKKKFKTGSTILLCPPSAKAMECFGQNLDEWLKTTVETIKKYTDREIIIRTKPSRRDRVTVDSIEMALDKDVHCLVTYNSIAATEAILHGKPAFTLGPNAAQSMCHSDLSLIEQPKYPSLDEVEAWAAHLAYCQFTEAEMRDGTAWKILNEDV
ncbi:MAG: hypothetical protein RLZZ196_127 [Bacteroidota bacterium]|jgi:lipopolysaccharide biosynthesis glycosyltransferase